MTPTIIDQRSWRIPRRPASQALRVETAKACGFKDDLADDLGCGSCSLRPAQIAEPPPVIKHPPEAWVSAGN